MPNLAYRRVLAVVAGLGQAKFRATDEQAVRAIYLLGHNHPGLLNVEATPGNWYAIRLLGYLRRKPAGKSFDHYLRPEKVWPAVESMRRTEPYLVRQLMALGPEFGRMLVQERKRKKGQQK